MSPLLAHRHRLLWLAALATGLLLLAARPAHGAGLSWNAFQGTPGATDAENLSCTTGGYHVLVADFEVPARYADFVAMDAVIETGWFDVWHSPPLPPFWHFESSGCNGSGVLANMSMPADPAGRENPWGVEGGQSTVTVGYAPAVPVTSVAPHGPRWPCRPRRPVPTARRSVRDRRRSST